jgi:NADP-dependent 3-hydroxy acid dehydrogenase YdfG
MGKHGVYMPGHFLQRVVLSNILLYSLRLFLVAFIRQDSMDSGVKLIHGGAPCLQIDSSAARSPYTVLRMMLFAWRHYLKGRVKWGWSKTISSAQVVSVCGNKSSSCVLCQALKTTSTKPEINRGRDLLHQSTTIIRPNMFNGHSAPNEERGEALGKKMEKDLEFAGRVALITGGNSGIGAAAAKRVTELGAQVVITGRRQSEGRLLVNNIRRNGGSAAFIQADLSKPEQVKRIVPFALETFGRLDYAFNNAGISGDNRLLTDQTEKSFDSVFAVNVKALFLLLQDEVKQMMAQGQGGSIVNTASVGGLLAFPTAGPYVASKHAVLGLTKTKLPRSNAGDTVFG